MPDQPQTPPRIVPLSAPKPSDAKKKAGIGAALALILGSIYAVEGGYVNDRSDPGGATNYGVTEKVARAAGYRGDMRYFPKHCDGPSAVCADAIYLRDYIKKPGFMPVIEADPAVGAEMVDTGVNMGPRWPSQWFEQALNDLGAGPVPINGMIEPRDVSAYRRLQIAKGSAPACVLMLDRLDAQQEARYRAIVDRKPSSAKFLKGWLRNRIGNVPRKTCDQVLP